MSTFYPKYYYKDAVGMASSDVKPVYHSRMIDFAVQNVTTSDNTAMIAVPAFTMVMNCNYLTLTTVTSASATFEITALTSDKIFVASTTAVAAGSYGVPVAANSATFNTWFAAKDDIGIQDVAVANLTVGQIRVFALMVYPQPTSYVDVDGNTHTYTFTDRNNWTSTAPVIP